MSHETERNITITFLHYLFYRTSFKLLKHKNTNRNDEAKS